MINLAGHGALYLLSPSPASQPVHSSASSPLSHSSPVTAIGSQLQLPATTSSVTSIIHLPSRSSSAIFISSRIHPPSRSSPANSTSSQLQLSATSSPTSSQIRPPFRSYPATPHLHLPSQVTSIGSSPPASEVPLPSRSSPATQPLLRSLLTTSTTTVPELEPSPTTSMFPSSQNQGTIGDSRFEDPLLKRATEVIAQLKVSVFFVLFSCC